MNVLLVMNGEDADSEAGKEVIVTLLLESVEDVASAALMEPVDLAGRTLDEIEDDASLDVPAEEIIEV